MSLARHTGCLLCLLGLAILAGCGSPGIPRPPSLDLPEPVSDLRAARKGDRVYLAWSVPTEDTDGERVRRLGATQICRNLDREVKDCTHPVGEVPAGNPPAPEQKTQAGYADNIPPQFLTGNPEAQIFYAVSALNEKGRSAGMSNLVSVPAVIALPPPPDFRAQLTASGVVLSWTMQPAPETTELRHVYRIYRRLEGTKTDTVAGQVPFADSSTAQFVDHDFEWEKTYLYRVTVVEIIGLPGRAESEFEGDDTPAQTVFAHDVFPPAVPAGLQAVFSGVGQQPFIDLNWIPDIDIDLAGYQVYRREAGGAAVKINSELVKSSAFRDTNVASGHTYFYSISAVDMRGNESSHSQEASERVP